MSSTVTAAGVDIPVWDYMTGHEWEQLEILLSDPPTSDLRADLLTLKIFVQSRTDQSLDVEAQMSGAVNGDEVSEAVEQLTVPFVEARRKRAQRQLRTQAHLLSPPELEKRAKETRATLEVIERLLSESNGPESKRSSSTTTQGGGSQGGKKGRSKKRSS